MQQFVLNRRALLMAGTATPFVFGCGGGGGETAPSGFSVKVAQPNEFTTLLSETTESESYKYTYTKPGNSDTWLPSSFTNSEGTMTKDLIFDEVGRPVVARDTTSGNNEQFFYPDSASVIAASFKADQSFVGAQAFWTTGNRFYTGRIPSVASVVPADATDIIDITEAVNLKRTEVASSLPATVSALQRFGLVGIAHADTTDAQIKQFVKAYILSIISSVFPSLLVLAVGVAFFPAHPFLVAAAVLATFFLTWTRPVQAATLDATGAQSLVTEYLLRPFRGSLGIRGGISIPAGVVGERGCSGSFSTIGSLTVALQPGTTALATIDAVEYISGSCFRQVFKKDIGATLNRSGNTLSGQSTSNPAFNNPYIYDLIISPDGNSMSGVVSNPYNATNGVSGNASGTVYLTR